MRDLSEPPEQNGSIQELKFSQPKEPQRVFFGVRNNNDNDNDKNCHSTGR